MFIFEVWVAYKICVQYSKIKREPNEEPFMESVKTDILEFKEKMSDILLNDYFLWSYVLW